MNVGRVTTTVNAICIITSCAIIMPVGRNRLGLVWSVLTYHPRTYTHSASAVMQQLVCVLYHIIRAVSLTPVGWQMAKYDSRPKYQNLYNEFLFINFHSVFSLYIYLFIRWNRSIGFYLDRLLSFSTRFVHLCVRTWETRIKRSTNTNDSS